MTVGIEGDVDVETGLEALSELASKGIERERLRGAALAVDDAPPGGEGERGKPFDRLAAAARSLGILREPTRLSTELFLAQAPVGTTWLVEDAAGRPWALEARGARARVRALGSERAEWLDASSLASRLGAPSPTAELAFHAIEAGLSFEGVSAAAVGASPTRRVLGLLRSEGRDVGVVVVYGVAIGLLALATPIAVQALVSTVAFGTLLQPIVILSLLLFACLALGATLRALEAWVVEVLQRRLFVRLVGDLAHRLPRVEHGVHAMGNVAELVNRFFDLFTVQKAAASLLLGGIESALVGTVGLVVLAFYHPILLAFDLVLLAAILGVFFVLGRGGVTKSVKESKAKYAVAGWLEEITRNPLAFKLDGGPAHAVQRTDDLARRYLEARAASFGVVFRQSIGALALSAVSSATLLAVGGWLVISSRLTLGQLVAAELIVATVAASLAKLGKHADSYYDLAAAVDKLGALVDLPLERDGGAIEATGRGPARLVLEGVSTPTLRDVSLSLSPGERVAIVDAGGRATTELVDRLFGLAAPDAGVIRLDGGDVRQLSLDALRARVALVRGPEAMLGTVLDNVRVGRSDVRSEDVREALRKVGLLRVVEHMPDGLSTRLDLGGRPLTRTEAQKLTIARAIARRPGLLVLDEAFDSVGASARAELGAALLGGPRDTTVLVVTDEPSIWQRCDRVLAVEGGRLVAHADEGRLA